MAKEHSQTWSGDGITVESTGKSKRWKGKKDYEGENT